MVIHHPQHNFIHMKQITSLLAGLLSILTMKAQQVEKIYLDIADSTRNCYVSVIPESRPCVGILFLIGGFGEDGNDVMTQTQLPVHAAEQGILTVIPTFQDGSNSFGFDRNSQDTFQKIVDDAMARYHLHNCRYYVGGFSMGGCAAVKYAEEAVQKPAAVFAIDSPIDIERFYNATKREAALLGKNDGTSDSIYGFLLSAIERIMGGTPQTVQENYHKHSPYSLSDSAKTAIRPLISVPVRVYIEPDIEWWLNERQTDAYGLNIIDCSAFINDLRHLGNKQAVLITTHGKGFRLPTMQPHPHSWSIVDDRDLIAWLLSCK